MAARQKALSAAMSSSLRACFLLSVFLGSINACALKPAFAQTKQFYANGQPVTAELYQAINLDNEGLALLRDNRNDEAIEKFSGALALAPAFSEAHHNLALALAKTGRTQEAIGHLQKAVELNPDLDPALLTLGGLYQSTGQIDLAIRTYKEFLRRFPADREAGKIANLVKGLEKVNQSMGGNPLADGNFAAQDYVSEVTRAGFFRWPASRMPLAVYISSGEGVSSFRPEFASLLSEAFEDWSNASGGRVKIAFVKHPSAASIECSWLDNPLLLSNSAESGEAKVITDSEGIKHGTIKLLTVPQSKQLPLTDKRMRQICLHEVGHVLGLAGHTSNPDDAMFFSSTITDQWKNLSTRDSNTISRLYTMNSPDSTSIR
jgi:tetratricopeptide (TPR) repeat protein